MTGNIILTVLLYLLKPLLITIVIECGIIFLLFRKGSVITSYSIHYTKLYDAEIAVTTPFSSTVAIELSELCHVTLLSAASSGEIVSVRSIVSFNISASPNIIV